MRAVFLRFAAGKFTEAQVGPLWWLSTNPAITSFGTGAPGKPCLTSSMQMHCRQYSARRNDCLEKPAIHS